MRDHHVVRLSHALTLALACVLAGGCATTTRSTTSSLNVVYPTLTPDQSSDIAIYALGLVGTPYRYGGNTPDSGFDCSGLIGYVYRSRVGIAPPRTVAQLDQFGQSVSTRDLRTGDLVLFGAGRPFHAGIYVGAGRFVHAPSTGGVVRLDQLSSVYWSRQVVTARRP